MNHPIPAAPTLQWWLRKSAATGSPAGIAAACKLAKDAGMSAIAFHAGPRDLAAHFDACERIAADHGLVAGGAWGLDGSKDVDGSALTAREKGALMGEVLARPTCAFGLADAEGQWDVNAGPGDETTEAGALALGEELRKLAPHTPVGDQLWFAIQSHGDARKTAKPIGEGGPFAGFPADEFAFSCVDWVRFRQAYCNNFPGKNRYRRVFDWMDADWREFDATLTKANRADLKRALGVTIQAYGWTDILPDLVECLLEYCAVRGQPVMLWCEGTPEPATMAGIRAFNALVEGGFATPGLTPTQIVAGYQWAYNKTAPESSRLATDGRCGARTLASLGIT